MEFDAEKADKFIERYSTTIDSIAKISSILGLASHIIYLWRQKNDDFDKACVKARSFRAEVMVDKALEIVGDASQDFYIDPKGIKRIDHEAVNRTRTKAEVHLKLAGIYNAKYSSKVMPADMPKRNKDTQRMNELFKQRKKKEQAKLKVIDGGQSAATG